MNALQDRLVLVTGAYRGIGAACARAFAEAGARVACADIRKPEETLASLEPRANGTGHVALVCDVADERSVAAMFEDLGRKFGGVDILMHCAGVIHEAPLLETDVATFDRVVGINLRGSFLVGKAAIGMMQTRGGRVILTASDLSYLGRETFSPYVASKHGVLGLTRSWAREFAPRILVNALCPGPIDTEMLGAAEMSAEWRAREMDIPLGRFGRPEEIAAMAVFLAGPGGDFVTGQGIGVNGGSVMP